MRKALAAKPYVRKVLDLPIEMVKKNMVCDLIGTCISHTKWHFSMQAAGTERRSLVGTLLSTLGPEEEEDIKGVGAVLYAGAYTATGTPPLVSPLTLYSAGTLTVIPVHGCFIAIKRSLNFTTRLYRCYHHLFWRWFSTLRYT